MGKKGIKSGETFHPPAMERRERIPITKASDFIYEKVGQKIQVSKEGEVQHVRLSARHCHAVSMYLVGSSVPQAAKAAGIGAATLSRVLNSPVVHEWIAIHYREAFQWAKGLFYDALDTTAKLLKDTDKQIQLKAAGLILQNVGKAMGNKDLDEVVNSGKVSASEIAQLLVKNLQINVYQGKEVPEGEPIHIN